MDYFHGGDKPHIVSGADDRTVKIWDYQVYLRDIIRSFELFAIAYQLVKLLGACNLTIV